MTSSLISRLGLKPKEEGITPNESRALKGMAILLVMFHHFAQHYGLQCPDWFIMLRATGPAACSLFFLLSGYGLTLSSGSVRQCYWHRRFVMILVPFYLANFLSISLKAFVSDSYQNAWLLLTDIVGITLANPTYWFIHCLLMLYVGFWTAAKHGWILKVISCLVMGIIYTVASRNIGSLSWIAFLLGILMAYNKWAISRALSLTAVAVSLLTLCYYYQQDMLVNTPIRLANFIAMIFSFPIAALSVRKSMNANFVLKYLGTRSMSFYLMHFLALLIAERMLTSFAGGGNIL